VVVWILLVVGTICVVECFIRLPLVSRLKSLQNLVTRIVGVLKSSSISDHWKEKVLPVYAGKLFLLSIQLFSLVVAALLPMFVLAWAVQFTSVPLMQLLTTWSGMLASTVIAVLYIFARNRVI
jgi:hypothetical protein